jgi:integrase
MSLYRRGRIWWIELTANGRRLRESAGTADKKAAQEYHEKRRGEIWRQGKLGEAPPVTWGEAVARWLKEKERSLPERYMIGAFGLSPTERLPLSESRILGLLSHSSPGTFIRKLGLITAIHSTSRMAIPSIRRPKAAPGRLRWLTKEEWGRLRKALAEESERRVAWFYGDQMKGKVAHGIPLNDDAMAVLEARRRLHKQYVFAHPESGKPLYKASNRAWYNALRKSKLKKTGVVWHSLRHTWAAWAVMSGVRLEEVMRLGGWKTYSMVLRYSHLSTEHLAEAAARVKPISLSYNAPKRGVKVTKTPTVGA